MEVVPRMRENKEQWQITEILRILSEGLLYYDGSIPAQVVGLTYAGRDRERFLLDVELGVIYWPDAPSEIRGFMPKDSSPEEVLDNAWDYAASDGEAEWRDSGSTGAWPVVDFFEMLKVQYRKLNFIPTGPGEVMSIWTSGYNPVIEHQDQIREIFTAHGWPDLGCCRKTECLQAVQDLLKDCY